MAKHTPEPEELARLRQLHRENARILGILCNELDGQIDPQRLDALKSACGRCLSALTEMPE